MWVLGPLCCSLLSLTQTNFLLWHALKFLFGIYSKSTGSSRNQESSKMVFNLSGKIDLKIRQKKNSYLLQKDAAAINFRGKKENHCTFPFKKKWANYFFLVFWGKSKIITIIYSQGNFFAQKICVSNTYTFAHTHNTF